VRAQSPSRIPSLDGLRAISIAFVIFAHLTGAPPFDWPHSVLKFLQLGELGVRVFFVISGFLITTLLISEEARTQRISLPKFYFRRTLRIFPAYYLYIALITGFAAFGYVHFLDGDRLHAITYTMNYHQHRAWYLGHLWSLSVEEQFYLLWPALVLMLGVRRALWLAGAFALASPLLRAASWFAFPASRLGIGERFFTGGDAIAAGCVLAGARGWLAERPWYQRIQKSALFVVVPLGVLAANCMHDHPVIDIVICYFLMNVGIVLVIDWCVTHPDGLVGSALNARVPAFIGTMSYSIYLWQQPFLNRHNPSLLTRFPLNLALLFASALASYYLIEKPFLRLRERLEPRFFPRKVAAPVVADSTG
jgi:peptidoglycan/LPS O-acetylase OafA/YrhL